MDSFETSPSPLEKENGECTLAVNPVPVDSASTYHDGNPPQNKCAGVRSSLGGERASPAG